MALAAFARRRFVERAPRNATFDALHRIADTHYPALRDLFTEAWQAMAQTLDVALLQRALTDRNLPAVLVLLEQAWGDSSDAMLRDPLRRLIQAITAESATASQAVLAPLPGVGRAALGLTFGTTHPLVLDFAATQSATLIREVGVETRQAIRSMLLANMEAGKGWQALVPHIRDTIGVTRRQADALATLRGRLTAEGKLSAARIDRLVEQKTRAYKRLRARTVARHESMVAAAAGAQAARVALMQQGVMDPAQYKKYFVVTPDERRCDVCTQTRQRNADGVGVFEAFDTPNGPYQHPPIHILCRCVATVKPTSNL